LFEDMGWYKVNYNSPYISYLVWGYQLGCAFVNDTCKKWPFYTEKLGYRCDESSPNFQLLFDQSGVGFCNFNSHHILDSGCNYYVPAANSLCDNYYPETVAVPSFSASESYGPDSRSFLSDIVRLPFSNIIKLGQVPQLKCYKTSCQSTTKLKVLVDEIWYECPYEGGKIKPIGFGGSIHCLPQAADRICLGNHDEKDWPILHTTLPRRGSPGTVITIYGENFIKSGNISINITFPLLNVTVISDFEITAVFT